MEREESKMQDFYMQEPPMPNKDSAELREAVSVFEQNLVACGIDASNVDYDKLADTRQKLWDELDRITDAHTAAQVAAAVPAAQRRLCEALKRAVHEHLEWPVDDIVYLLYDETGDLIEAEAAHDN